MNQTVSSVQAILKDNSGSGINFDTTVTYLTLFHPPWPVALPGTLSNDGDSTLTFTLEIPLRDNGTDDGLYRLMIWGEDKIGQPLAPTNPETTVFVYDTRSPDVDSTVPDSGATGIILRDSVYAYVSDIFPGVSPVSGIDFVASSFFLEGPDGGIPGNYFYVNNGDSMGVLIWRFNPGVELPNGTYTMNIHLEDRAGNTRDKTISFEGGAQLPEVITLFPSQDTLNFLDRIYAVFLDNSGSGVDTVLSTLTLDDPMGNPISGVRSWSGDTLTLFVDTLAQDGSLDGTFTITALPYSNDTLVPPGNPAQSTFLYDTKSPVVLDWYPVTGDTIDTLDVSPFPPDSVTAMVGDPLILTTGKGGTIGLRGLRIADWGSKGFQPHDPRLLSSAGSGIDFSNSTIGLIGPSGPMIGNSSNDGVSTLIFTPDLYGEDGLYQITVKLQDFAGNVAYDTSAFYIFLGLQAIPQVVSTTPDSGATVTTPLDSVFALLSFSDNTSTITLTDSAGSVVDGSDTLIGNTLIYRLTNPPLAEPGEYTITVIARRTGIAEEDTLIATFQYIPPYL
ncbi:hypothetical protein IIA15_11675 [candidate division TA06 bacterium]|nr:hypothetical protein [candidate division TA06 bacterium]